MKAYPLENNILELKETIDFQKDKKLMIWINAAGILSFAVFYLIFHFSAVLLLGIKTNSIYYFLERIGNINSAYTLFLIFVMTIIHESIHGIFFFLSTSSKPVFGFKSLFAYAGAPLWMIRKDFYLLVSLSPLVIMTLAGFLLMIFLPDEYTPVIFLLITANAAGSAGDIWVSLILLAKPRETFINDTGLSSGIYF